MVNSVASLPTAMCFRKLRSPELMKSSSNLDTRIVADFGDEWTRFDQSTLPASIRAEIFEAYFRSFPWNRLPPGAIGADFGCGSGRWAAVVAPRVGKLY